MWHPFVSVMKIGNVFLKVNTTEAVISECKIKINIWNIAGFQNSAIFS